jgi:hypothetical protein
MVAGAVSPKFFAKAFGPPMRPPSRSAPEKGALRKSQLLRAYHLYKDNLDKE